MQVMNSTNHEILLFLCLNAENTVCNVHYLWHFAAEIPECKTLWVTFKVHLKQHFESFLLLYHDILPKLYRIPRWDKTLGGICLDHWKVGHIMTNMEDYTDTISDAELTLSLLLRPLALSSPLMPEQKQQEVVGEDEGEEENVALRVAVCV